MPYIEDSILDTTKKILGIDSEFEHFDTDIIIHINSVFAGLIQLGAGPEDGFEIEDSTATWDSYLNGNKKLSFIKSYMYLKVRMLFDPPTTSFDITAKQDQIKEFEFRINVAVQSDQFAHFKFDIPANIPWRIENKDD